MPELTTTEIVKQALIVRGFVDVQEEHPWNEIQMERWLGKAYEEVEELRYLAQPDSQCLGLLTVWGRDDQKLHLVLAQGYEECVTLFSTTADNHATLIKAVELVLEYALKMQQCYGWTPIAETRRINGPTPFTP